jgi:hypothetical protein
MQTIEDAFTAYWKTLVEEDSGLAQYPKSFHATLKHAFTRGYIVGSAHCQIELEPYNGGQKQSDEPAGWMW